jgi:hypothetical protein
VLVDDRMTNRAPEPDIRRADASELDIAADILEEAASWSATEALGSWTPGVFTGSDSVGMSRLRSDMATGGLHLVRIAGRVAATFSLLERDTLYWPLAGDEALYLHRFGVRRSAAGVGRLAIAWMVREAQRRGREYLRLDCLADNPRIRRYYESCGFAAVDQTVIDGTRYSLYEMPVAERAAEA